MDAELRDRWLAHAHATIGRAGLRTGAAREGVVALLAREGQCLLSAQDLTDRARGQGVGSAASVYRILDELFALGLVHRVRGPDGVGRYEIADPDGHHHHVVDQDTGEIRAFADERLEREILAAAQRLGLELTGHDVVLHGRAGAGRRA